MKFISDLIEQWSCPFPCTRFYKGCMIHSDQFSAAEADGTAFVSPQSSSVLLIHSALTGVSLARKLLSQLA